MLAKLRLDQAAVYEQAIAAYKISKMLCAFIEGRKHILCIGAEQGDISGWDDFIIQECLSEFIHLQIKKQNTDFAPLNNCIKQANTTLTPLDNSMLSLAEWIRTHNPALDSTTRHFRLCLPHDGPVIKRNLEIRNLRDFMALNINATTTTQGLDNLQNVAQDGTAINLYNWLTTWCGFTDWDHIRRALQKLQIYNYGNRTDIDAQSIEQLSRVFREPVTVLTFIKSYTLDNSAYTASISPRQLLFELKGYLLDTQKTWTQISSANGNWEISGIHDLENNLEVERPSKIIPLLWSNERGRDLNINIAKVVTTLSSIHESIFRLAIHLDGNISGLCANWDGWKVCIENKIGGTLGILKNDFEGLSIADNNAPFKISGGKTINTNAERENFAKEMSDQMTKRTWELVSEKISEQISEMDARQSQELRDAVEARWKSWQETIQNDKSILAGLLTSIVHPNAEGEEILGCLRIGPKTKLLIADALFTCLLISVALDPSDSGIMKIENGLSIGAIGLNWWSGPAGKTKRVRRIDDEESVNDLIGKEAYDILIISQSDQPEGEIYKQSMGESASADYSLAGGQSPKLLITPNRRFSSIIKTGSIDQLQTYLQQKLTTYKKLLIETLNNNTL